MAPAPSQPASPSHSPAPDAPSGPRRSLRHRLAKQGQMEGLRSVLSVRSDLSGRREWPLFGQTGSNRGPLFGPVWPNGAGGGASAEEGGAGLAVPKSGEETGAEGHQKRANAEEWGGAGKGKETGREGDESGAGEGGRWGDGGGGYGENVGPDVVLSRLRLG